MINNELKGEILVIGIIGSRRRNTEVDYQLVLEAFNSIYRLGDTIVSGGCYKGGDRFAERIAKLMDIPIKIHKARWDLYHKGAGIKRNTFIAQDADKLIACIALDRTGGTEDTIRKFLRLGKQQLFLV